MHKIYAGFSCFLLNNNSLSLNEFILERKGYTAEAGALLAVNKRGGHSIIC